MIEQDPIKVECKSNSVTGCSTAFVIWVIGWFFSIGIGASETTTLGDMIWSYILWPVLLGEFFAKILQN